MHGAAVPSNSAVMSPLLVAKTTVCLAFGVGDGSGGRPTSKRFGFFVSVAADSAYLHGPLVFFGARAAIFFGVRDGSGVWVLLGLGDDEGCQHDRGRHRGDQRPALANGLLLLAAL